MKPFLKNIPRFALLRSPICEDNGCQLTNDFHAHEAALQIFEYRSAQDLGLSEQMVAREVKFAALFRTDERRSVFSAFPGSSETAKW